MRADYHTISHLFGVSKSTVSLVSKDVCSAIVKTTALKEIVDGFKRDLGFPQ